MSNFISSISARRLERNAAGVEGDALADQHDRFLRSARPPRYSSTISFGGWRDAVRHRQQGAHAELLHVRALEHLDFHAVVLGEVARLLRPDRSGCRRWRGRLPRSRRGPRRARRRGRARARRAARRRAVRRRCRRRAGAARPRLVGLAFHAIEAVSASRAAIAACATRQAISRFDAVVSGRLSSASAAPVAFSARIAAAIASRTGGRGTPRRGRGRPAARARP